MPKKPEKKEVSGAKESGTDVNKAKTAFDDYKKRIATVAFKTGNKDVKTGKTTANQHIPGQPTMQPFMQMPQPPFQLPPGMMPQQVQYNPHMPFSPSMGQSGTTLFNSLGSMLRLGIDLVNASLAGGLQLMEGFYGGGHSYGNSCTPSSCCCEPEPCNCCEQPSCCEPCDCCNPSVHNCC